ncbi:hypothetical protein, partial [Rodentibacter trehalosifermentans]|uniref:hypothetical protein n=1 Tax=Rodentibacter trehalosifermentans TaxID=1908263 RepID=UPI002118069B
YVSPLNKVRLIFDMFFLLSQAKANFDSANKEAKEWETGGTQRRILDSALNVLSTALGGRPVAEVIASGLSPTVNHQIKEATTDKNGNVNTALNLTAHALWGRWKPMPGIAMWLQGQPVRQQAKLPQTLSLKPYTTNPQISSVKRKNSRSLL